MPPEDSQAKMLRPNDEIYTNGFNNLISNNLQDNRLSILNTIDAEDRQTSRCVGFANDFFFQVKSDGTTQLIAEPFKSNLSDDKIVTNQMNENQANASFEFAKVQAIKSDNYATGLNSSVNRRNAKRKFEEIETQNLTSLFCNEDMELTKLDKENSSKFAFKNSSILSSSDMNLTFATNKENSFQPNHLASFTSESSLLQFPVKNSKLNNLFTSKIDNNQTFESEMDISQNLTCTNSRMFNSKCAKLNLTSVRLPFSPARCNTNSSWAIKKDKLHSILNFKNCHQSLFKKNNIASIDRIASPLIKSSAFVNKTLPISLERNIQTPVFDRPSVDKTELLNEDIIVPTIEISNYDEQPMELIDSLEVENKKNESTGSESLCANLSNLEKDLNRDTVNDSVHAFQKLTNSDRIRSTELLNEDIIVPAIEISNYNEQSMELIESFEVENKKNESTGSESLCANLSNLEKDLNRDTVNDSVLAFQTLTNSDKTPSSLDLIEKSSKINSTNHQENELEEQVEMQSKQINDESNIHKSMNSSDTEDKIISTQKDEIVEEMIDLIKIEKEKNKPIRRESLLKNLSILEKELNTDKMNDSVFSFENLTNLDEVSSTELVKTSSNINYTIHQQNELEEQVEMANRMMSEKSFFTGFYNGVQMRDENKLKTFFIEHNKNQIRLKSFNHQVSLTLELENEYENEYSNIYDMKLVFDFDKPMIKLWSDKFYLFYSSRSEEKNFIEILKMILIKNLDNMKPNLLNKYKTTEFLVQIEQKVEMMLNRVSEFAKDIKITTLKFIKSEFKLKSDYTFDLYINLFGLSNKRFTVILNINYETDEFSIKPRFNCWYDEKKYYPFDIIKSIVEEFNKEKVLKINKITNTINAFIRKLKSLYLERRVKGAIKELAFLINR